LNFILLFLQDVITKVCYDGKPYSKEETEASLAKHKKEKKPSTYQKLKNIYDQSLAFMSEAAELTEEYRKARKEMNKTFFSTKVEQAEVILILSTFGHC